MKKGDVVTVFHDPYTQKEIEGTARIVKVIREVSDDVMHAEVRFLNRDRGRYQRWLVSPVCAMVAALLMFASADAGSIQLVHLDGEIGDRVGALDIEIDAQAFPAVVLFDKAIVPTDAFWRLAEISIDGRDVSSVDILGRTYSYCNGRPEAWWRETCFIDMGNESPGVESFMYRGSPITGFVVDSPGDGDGAISFHVGYGFEFASAFDASAASAVPESSAGALAFCLLLGVQHGWRRKRTEAA